MFYRHGDVNLHEVKEVQGKKLEHSGKWILAHGEATGSVHEIETPSKEGFEVYQNEDGTIYLRVLEEAIVTHTHDHETIIVKPGIYKQVPERECDHFANSVVRKVVD